MTTDSAPLPTHYDRLTRAQVGEIAGEAVLVIPVGATEQHGPNLPLATDHAICEALVTQAVDTGDFARPVVVAPTLAYGHSEHHLAFAAASLRPATFLAVLNDLIRSAVISGFRRVMIVNGHGGNAELIRLAVTEASNEHDGVFAALSYWDAVTEVPGGKYGVFPGHAGKYEASLLMNVRPDLLDPATEFTAGEPRGQMQSQIGIGGRALVLRTDDWSATGGWTDDPAGSSAEDGEPYRTAIVAGLQDRITAFCAIPIS